VDVGEERPADVLRALYGRLDDAVAQGRAVNTAVSGAEWSLLPKEVKAATKWAMTAEATRARLRALVCGGDGTVGSVLSAVGALGVDMPVGVVPLGTGNDLARALGWDGQSTGADADDDAVGMSELVGALERVALADTGELDRWRIRVSGLEGPSVPLGLERRSDTGDGAVSIAAPVLEGTFYNYWSTGGDAATAGDFDALRRERPELYVSPTVNQAIYAGLGAKYVLLPWTAPLPDLQNVARVEGIDADGDSWREVAMPADCSSLVILNFNSYAGGKDLWGASRPDAPRVDDGLLGLLAFRNLAYLSMSFAVGGSTSHRLGKFRGLRITFGGSDGRGGGNGHGALVPQQLDGEPFSHDMAGANGPCVAEVLLDGKSRVVLFPSACYCSLPATSELEASGTDENRGSAVPGTHRRQADLANHRP